MREKLSQRPGTVPLPPLVPQPRRLPHLPDEALQALFADVVAHGDGDAPKPGHLEAGKEGEELGREQKGGPGFWGESLALLAAALGAYKHPKVSQHPPRAGRAPTPTSRDDGGGAGHPGQGMLSAGSLPVSGDSRGAAGSEHPPDLLGLLDQVPAVQAHPDGAVPQLVQGQRHGTEIGQAAPDGGGEEKD